MHSMCINLKGLGQKRIIFEDTFVLVLVIFTLPTIENNDNSALDIEDIGENGWWVIIRDGVQKTIEVLELSGHFWQKE